MAQPDIQFGVPSSVKGIVKEKESQLRLVTSVRLRWAAVVGQLTAVLVVHYFYGFPLPLGPCLAVVAASAWLNIYLVIRYPTRHRFSISMAFALLLHDTLQLALLLYLTGGITNPFAVLLVAPVTVSAATLPPRYTMAVGAVALSAAGFLIKHYQPMPWYIGLRFELPWDYRLGIWVALAAASSFVAFYAWRLNKESRQMAAALAATDMVLASEQRLHALDGLAAAAAHELGTPLSTIVLVSKELQTELGKDSQYLEDLQLIGSQATRCREILQQLTRKPDERDPMHETIAVEELIEEAAEPYRDRGKRVTITSQPMAGQARDKVEEPTGHRRPGVKYGLGNIIENAVGYAKSEVHLDARWSDSEVVVTVTDDGPGFPPEIMDSIGEPYVTTRRFEDRGSKGHSGLGLGFFIAKTLLERSGATVTFTNVKPPASGAIVQISWPRKSFELPIDAFDWPGRRRG